MRALLAMALLLLAAVVPTAVDAHGAAPIGSALSTAVKYDTHRNPIGLTVSVKNSAPLADDATELIKAGKPVNCGSGEATLDAEVTSYVSDTIMLTTFLGNQAWPLRGVDGNSIELVTSNNGKALYLCIVDLKPDASKLVAVATVTRAQLNDLARRTRPVKR